MTGKLQTRRKPAAEKSNFYSWVKSLRHINRWNGLAPLYIFLILAVPAGVFLILNVPAFWAPDGGAHVARAFQIAEGGAKPLYINHNHGVGYGGEIPLNVNDLKNLELDIVSKSPAVPGQQTLSKIITPQDKSEIAKISSQKISKQRVLISYVNTAAYSPVAYAPNVVGLIIGMKLNFNLGHTLTLSRLFSFGTLLLCVGYALFTLRKSQMKWVVMTVALLPIVVFQASLITADSFLISVAILFSALILKALTQDLELTATDKSLLFLCTVLIPLLKSVYFPLAFLVLLVPLKRWRSPKNYWIWCGAALAISMLGFAVWSLVTADVAASNGLVRGDTFWNYGDANIQKHFVLTHPIGYLHAIADSIIYFSRNYTDNFFGWLGFTYLPIPGVALISGYLALGLSLLLSAKIKVQKHIAPIILGIVALTSLIILTTLYVYYTVPRNTVIEGVQGRYFMPLIILLIAGIGLAFPGLRIAREDVSNAKVLLVCLIAFCFVLSIFRYGLAVVS